jgi:hypothetical protein
MHQMHVQHMAVQLAAMDFVNRSVLELLPLHAHLLCRLLLLFQLLHPRQYHFLQQSVLHCMMITQLDLPPLHHSLVSPVSIPETLQWLLEFVRRFWDTIGGFKLHHFLRHKSNCSSSTMQFVRVDSLPFWDHFQCPSV